ncbi:MAG: hypothetical protein CBB79_06360 [Synechococcus sp. TMED19]|nr:MAG: hypothetical protein CBB79_06360 [Synechococcus sp. TMED19]
MQWIEWLTPFRWPLAVVITAALLGRALLALARSGIRVEIFTRVPIQIKTGRDAIEAKVTKVKLL